MTSQGVVDKGVAPQAPAHGRGFAGGWAELKLGAGFALRGRGSRWRLVMICGCVALGVVLLLLAAGLPGVATNREARTVQRTPIYSENAELSTVYIRPMTTNYHGSRINGQAITIVPGAQNPATPPGLDRTPQPGDFWVSPELHSRLADPANAELRQRFPYQETGQIKPAGLVGPDDLYFYLGLADGAGLNPTDPNNTPSIGWGTPTNPYVYTSAAGGSLTPALWVLLTVGLVILVVPILVFLGMLTRVGSASRDLRLTQMRFLGASRRQCRRIAAAEALVPAIVGSASGLALFLLIRLGAEHTSVLGFPIFAADIAPPLWLTVLILIASPVAAVALSWLALRRIFRTGSGAVTKRRLWWRLLIPVAGFVLLNSQDARLDDGLSSYFTSVVGGTALVLISVPILLPVLLRVVVALLPGGGPAWTLGLGSVKSDAGVSARIVGGIGLVLAGTIALQTLFTSGLDRYESPDVNAPQLNAGGTYQLVGRSLTDADAQILRSLPAIPGVLTVSSNAEGSVQVEGTEQSFALAVSDCVAIEASGRAPNETCVDGDTFVFAPAGENLSPGTVLTPTGQWPEAQNLGFAFTVPGNAKTVDSAEFQVTVTPKALAQAHPALNEVALFPTQFLNIKVDIADAGVLDRISTAISPAQWRIVFYDGNPDADVHAPQMIDAIQSGLLVGAGLTMLFALASLTLMVLEHIRSRRRAWAMVVAAGVPHSTLVRAQVIALALPLGLAVVVSNAIGIALSWVLLNQAGEVVEINFASAAGLSAIAIVLTLLVGLVTAPTVRGATRPESLRAE